MELMFYLINGSRRFLIDKVSTANYYLVVAPPVSLNSLFLKQTSKIALIRMQ